jgi:hypothetical protein
VKLCKTLTELGVQVDAMEIKENLIEILELKVKRTYQLIADIPLTVR